MKDAVRGPDSAGGATEATGALLTPPPSPQPYGSSKGRQNFTSLLQLSYIQSGHSRCCSTEPYLLSKAISCVFSYWASADMKKLSMERYLGIRGVGDNYSQP